MGDISIKGHSPILRQGFAKGGRAGFKHGTKPDWKKGKFGKKTIAAMKKHDFPAGGPHQSLEGKKAALRHASIRAHEHKHGRDSKAEGGRIGFQEGKRVDVPSSSQWKKPADKNLKRGQAEDAMEQYKNQPKKLKFRCG